MQIRVGLLAGDLVTGTHMRLTVSASAGPLIVEAGGQAKTMPSPVQFVAAGDRVLLLGDGAAVALGQKVLVRDAKPAAALVVASAGFDHVPAKNPEAYRGVLELSAQAGGLKAVLITDLESYVQGVLQSEMPGSFHLEALKAQAVVARTYGLHPRLSHAGEGFNVCDSYLHCQAFYGLRALTEKQRLAIGQTADEILLYRGEPALALFSACAGGHTESYQYCFSDPLTGAFPPPPIPYLTGVSEGQLPAGYPDEAAMRKLFAQKDPDTFDAWSAANFRWRVHFSADQLEGHMHFVAQQLMADRQFAPFIHPPASGKFGHIHSFAAARRGVAGTIVELVVHTSEGAWRIEKELVVRNLFANPDLKLKRLKSARIFFDQSYDALGLLSFLTVSGFGSGHGVGLQQIGAQGMAKRGADYKRIIAHYYAGAVIGKAG